MIGVGQGFLGYLDVKRQGSHWAKIPSGEEDPCHDKQTGADAGPLPSRIDV